MRLLLDKNFIIVEIIKNDDEKIMRKPSLNYAGFVEITAKNIYFTKATLVEFDNLVVKHGKDLTSFVCKNAQTDFSKDELLIGSLFCYDLDYAIKSFMMKWLKRK